MLYPLLQASSWAMFVGRFHPALVHFPIGFLLIAALLEIGRRTGKVAVSESAIRFILFFSAIGATLACVAGYLLSLGGGYDEQLLDNHMWQGIGVAVFAWIAWLIKSDRLKSKVPYGSLIYLPAFLLATILTLTAGHDGGSLTHGQGYLTQYTPEPFRGLAGIPPLEEKGMEIKPLSDVQQAVVYNEIVQPILQARCAQCHNASKQKGDLRVDQLALLLKGGEGGPAFIPGKGSESDMIKRCLLDENDDDHMPPKGKPQLTTDQIELISWWIDQGAPADKKVAELKMTEAIKPALASLGQGAVLGKTKKQESAVLSLKVPAASEQALENLRKAGLIVNTLSQDQNLIEVSAVNAPNFDDKQMELLKPVAEQIAWLKLGDTKITDAALEQISKFPNLNKLHLEHTVISDKGINGLKGLKYLEYLNVVDTKVGDAGLKNVAGMKGLRSVYVWQSAVTDSAVSQVSKQNPDLLVVNGFNEAAVAEFLRAGDTTSTKAEAKKL
ncbi:c-type cytochrome domain-containing protein [Dyadobacter arcticus]|uniref:Membrane protein/mono/diheme cytochrome c family protein n=1 Tax=Dyadobacter arcticus TaxID=1078754 RepID=A0ABX0UD55_9BACT|nr:c-type cytochrome domain-containing protein [Dyadobacter arcticus]NIJ50927.1 putative membrane protein/mono/diheme cytochrome c family protein [Dyadobacter arcticus]